MGKSPFWLLAVGLGLAFLVTSGRAEAVYKVLTSPVGIDPTNPTTTPGHEGECLPGYIYDQGTRKCIQVNAPGQHTCQDGYQWSDSAQACLRIS